MEQQHHLKALLQLQLATDASATLHIPYILSTLTEANLLPSSHLGKWLARINSLLHSKDAGARWSGLCLAHKTSTLSKSIMIEHAQSWLGVALPMLSKNEPVPTLKAAIQLLRAIFRSAVGIPEYQRQVATPNVPKFSSAIIGLAEKHEDEKLRVLILRTLTQIVLLYPTLNRPLYAPLSALSLRFLNGSAPNPTSKALLDGASCLYATLPSTGGKVGAANHWRKAIDDTMTFAWAAFAGLRTTYHNEVYGNASPTIGIDDSMMAVPLNLDRLRCCTAVLCDLLSTPTQRPVQIPLGAMIKFITALLSCTKDDKGVDYAETTIQVMEVSVIPDLWRLACQLLSCLARCARHHLTPTLTHLLACLVFHLEQKPVSAQGAYFLSATEVLLSHCHPLDSPPVLTRLIKAVLPTISNILVAPLETQKLGDSTTISQRNKKGKKRARGYEGDEVFKLAREVLCPAVDDRAALLTALEVTRRLLHNPNLSQALHSISVRVLLSLLLALPQMSPTSLSPDPSFHKRLLQKVHTICTELGVGTTSIMSKSLGLVIHAALSSEGSSETFRDLEILIHPRVPPLVRSLPHVESLSLFHAEESQEEAEIRKDLGLCNLQQQALDQPSLSHNAHDTIMEDSTTFTPESIGNTQPMSATPPPKSTVARIDSQISVQQLTAFTAIPQPHAYQEYTAPESTTEVPRHTAVLARRDDDDDDDDEEDEGEDIPIINMESDSDEE